MLIAPGSTYEVVEIIQVVLTLKVIGEILCKCKTVYMLCISMTQRYKLLR